MEVVRYVVKPTQMYEKVLFKKKKKDKLIIKVRSLTAVEFFYQGEEKNDGTDMDG